MALPIRQALTIGNNAYTVGGNPLTSCINDARDVANTLRSIGFQSTAVSDVDLNSMKAITQRFVQSIQPGAIVVFYFSGHGVQYDGYNFLMPLTDIAISSDNVKQYALSAERLIEDMHTRNPRVVIVILDSCRAYWGTQSLLRQRPWDRTRRGLKQGLAPMRVPPSTIVAYACAAEDLSSQEAINNRNSLYTYHLLRHIATPNVDIEHVLRCVAIDVQRDPLNDDLKQIPYRYSSCNEYICLAPNLGMNVPIWPKLMQSRAGSASFKNSLPKVHSNRHSKPKHHQSIPLYDPSKVMRYPVIRPMYYRRH